MQTQGVRFCFLAKPAYVWSATMTSSMTAEQVIRLLDLGPLAGEGGYYRQTVPGGDERQPAYSAIYYLITPDSFSGLHRLTEPELFHFYAGDPCDMIQVTQDGQARQFHVGADLLAGQRPQVMVPAHTWQGTKLRPNGSWALLGTTMTPGFRPDMFELATRERLHGLPDDVQRVCAPILAANTP
jgi:predicted cupin superfamily sugar epimerase